MTKSSAKKNNDGATQQGETNKMPDPVHLTSILIEAYEKARPLMEDYLEKYASPKMLENLADQDFDPFNLRETYMEFLDKIIADPQKFLEMQAGFMQDWMTLWQESTLKFLGQDGKTIIEPDKTDRRFKAKEWQESALFDFIKQSYLLTCQWMDKTVHNVEGLDPKQREKLIFHTKSFANAISPTNFLLTNPEVLNETLKTGGENLVKGFENLIEDLKRGHGELQIQTTDYKSFKLGENIAVTKGQIIYQNDLIQLIQYEPQTEKSFKTPLLIIPPWINKYYILDLRPDKSLIEWAVKQGHTVFTISWVNPGPKLAHKRFEDYMNEGTLAALDEIEKITGEKNTNIIGYCLGGTLLAITLAYLAATKQENRVTSATFLTTLLDFQDAGDMKIFLDDEQMENLKRIMAQKGILEGKTMQRTFSLLRANDLIWSFVVNNYLMGREPFPFDLLYWNDDCTNMPAEMHWFYLQNMYRDNMLTKPGGITMNKVPIDLGKVKTPAYFLSTREDHIAPWKATYDGMELLGSPKTFTLAASGHIAGVVNPPHEDKEKEKYCYWANSPPNSSGVFPPASGGVGGEKTTFPSSDQWLKNAVEHKGSWWPHWQEWLKPFTNGEIPARKPAKGLEPAPGTYVKKRD